MKPNFSSVSATVAAAALVFSLAVPATVFADAVVAPASPPVVINEFVSNPASGSEWVELYNSGATSVDASTLSLTELSNPASGTPTENSISGMAGTIPAGGFLALSVSGLNNSGDSIGLYVGSSTTGSLADRVTYGTVYASTTYPVTPGLQTAPAKGQSGYRTTDGGSTWAITSTPTKGVTNIPSVATDSTSNTNYATLQAALDAASAGDTITLTQDIAVSTQLNVNTPVTIDGAGHTLTASVDFGSNNSTKHLINVYAGTNSTPVTLKNVTLNSNGYSYGAQAYGNAYLVLNAVTITNSKGAGLTVNGSTVTATGLTTSGNAWGAVNVDPGSGVTTPSVFTLISGSLAETTQIWSDGSNVTNTAMVTVTAPGYTEYKVAGTSAGYVWSNQSLANAATITEGATTTLYADVPSAIAAAQDGDTVVIGAGTYSLTSELDITKNISVEGNGSVTLKASTDFGSNNSSKHLIGLYAGTTTAPVTLSNLTLDSNGDSYGVNTYNNAYVVLNNVTLQNSKGAGLTVNGSTVRASGLSASGNLWGSVNVDPGSGVLLPSAFTLTSGALSDGTQIWSDGKNVNATSTVTVSAAGYTKYAVSGTTGYVWANGPVANAATVTIGGIPTLYSTIAAALAAATTSQTVIVGPGTYSGVSLTGSYASNLTIDGGSSATAIIEGLDLSGSTFNGLTFKNFTITGDSTGGGASVTIESPGSYSGLTFVGDTFDGGSVAGRRAIISNTGFDGFTLTDNVFKNYADSSSTAYSVVFMEAQDSAWGDAYTATGNTLTNSNLPNFLEAYRWKDVSFTGNTVNANDGRLLIWSDTQRGALESLGTIDVSGNTLTIGQGKGIEIYTATSTMANITGNTVKGGTACVMLYSVSNSNVSGNTLSNCTTAVLVDADKTSGPAPVSVFINNNSFSGNTTAIDNETSISVNAVQNWWNDPTGPNSPSTNPVHAGNGEPIVVGSGGGAAFSPWFADPALKTLGWPTSLSGASTTVTTGSGETTLSGTSTESGNIMVTATIPANATVTGPTGWSGSIGIPAATSTKVSFPGYAATTTAAITVGSDQYDLYFSAPVKLVFSGQKGERVGFYDAAHAFSEITNVCDTASAGTVSGIALATSSPGASCKHDDGNDLVVWTTHFSTFVAYSAKPNTPVISPNGSVFHGSTNVTMDDAQSGSVTHYTVDGTSPTCSSPIYTNGQTLVFSSAVTLQAIRCDSASSSAIASATFSPASGDGGGSVSTPAATTATTPAATTTTAPAAQQPQGQVLGASAYNFAKNLWLGSRGQDVTELQNVLIAGGFLKISVPTGYFGPATKAAVVAYQKAHGISPAAGFVGALTRAELNKGIVPTTPETATTTPTVTTNLSASQVNSILGVLESFNVDSATLAKVKAALGVN